MKPALTLSLALSAVSLAPHGGAAVVTRVLDTPLVASDSGVDLDVDADGSVEVRLTHLSEEVGVEGPGSGLFTLSLTQPGSVVAATEVPGGSAGDLFDTNTEVALRFDEGDTVEVRSSFSGELILAKHEVRGGAVTDAAGPFAEPPATAVYLAFSFPLVSGSNGYAELRLDPVTLEATVFGYAYETQADVPITIVALPEPTSAAVVLLGSAALVRRRRLG